MNTIRQSDTTFDDIDHEEILQDAADGLLSRFKTTTDLDMHRTNPWGAYGIRGGYGDHSYAYHFD